MQLLTLFLHLAILLFWCVAFFYSHIYTLGRVMLTFQSRMKPYSMAIPMVLFISLYLDFCMKFLLVKLIVLGYVSNLIVNGINTFLIHCLSCY